MPVLLLHVACAFASAQREPQAATADKAGTMVGGPLESVSDRIKPLNEAITMVV